MAIVFGTLTDPLGVPLNGQLVVTLGTFEVVADSVVRLPTPSVYEVIAGEINIELVALDSPYRFQFFKEQEPVPEGEDVPLPVPVFDFYARIPQGTLTILFAELLPTQIVRDVMDTSAKRVAQLVALDPALRQLVALKLNPRGEWDSSAYYTIDDVVTYDGGSYLATRNGFFTGVNPVESSHWFRLAQRGGTGTGTEGNDTPYDATGWEGQTDAPSRNAVRDIIETVRNDIDSLSFAPIDSPNLTGIPTVPTAPGTDDSSRIANTSFIWDVLAPLLSPVAPTQPYAPLPVPGDNTGAIATTQWVQSKLANVLTSPDNNIPFITNGGCNIRPLDNNGTAIAATNWVRTRTGGVNILSSGSHHIRLGTGATPGDGFLTIRFMQFQISGFSTSLVSGRHQFTTNVDFPSEVPTFPNPMPVPIPVVCTPRQTTSGSNDSVIQIVAQPIAGTRVITVTLVSNAALTSQSQNINCISIGYG